MRYMERRIHGSKRYEKDGDPYLLYGKDQTPAGCGARQENKETEQNAESMTDQCSRRQRSVLKRYGSVSMLP